LRATPGLADRLARKAGKTVAKKSGRFEEKRQRFRERHEKAVRNRLELSARL